MVGAVKLITGQSACVAFTLLARRCHALLQNTDAGTMSPFEHGEVFVLDDGAWRRHVAAE